MMSHEDESSGLHHADLLIALPFHLPIATTATSRCSSTCSAHVLPWSTSLVARLRSDQIHCPRLLSINDRQGSCEDNISRGSTYSRGKPSKYILYANHRFFESMFGLHHWPDTSSPRHVSFGEDLIIVAVMKCPIPVNKVVLKRCQRVFPGILYQI